MSLQTIRFENAVVFRGKNLPLDTVLTIRGNEIIANSTSPDRIIDCHGNAVVPAFVDSHCHPLAAARAALGPDVSNSSTIDEVRSVVSEWLKTNQDAPAAVGGFYKRDLAPNGFFAAKWLDDLDHRPIVLHSNDQHAIWVNRSALALAGLPTDGSTVGTLREDAKFPVLDALDSPKPEAVASSIENQLKSLAALGIVEVTDAWVDEAGFEAYGLVNSPLRVRQALWVQPGTNLSNLKPSSTIKVFLDGVLGSATALVSDPYVDEHSGRQGETGWTFEQFAVLIDHCAKENIEVLIHAIGDSAIDWIVKAHRPGLNFRIEHAETLREDQVTKLAELNGAVCFQPLWARPDQMYRAAANNLGSERAGKMYPFRSVLDAKHIAMCFGSDWPVSSADPLLGIFTAVHRREPNSLETHNPSQSIDLGEAFDNYTSKQAGDWVLLSGNPFADNGISLPQMSVLETFSGGRSIYVRH